MTPADSSPQSIGIYLIDDHNVVRAGVHALLEKERHIQVLGEAQTVTEALQDVFLLSPSIILVDLSLPEQSGIELVKQLKPQLPETRFIALTMHDDIEHIEAFFEAGGSGYVTKHAVVSQLLDAIAAVSRGEYYAPADLLAAMAERLAQPDLYKHVVLTKREQEVVSSIADGCTYKEIAEVLGISEKTVATYRERAAEKLGCKSRAELVRRALEHPDLSAQGING